MAISFPKSKSLPCVPNQTILTLETDLSELSAIPGIDQDKVQRYGQQILRLVDNAKRRYQELTQDAETSGVVPDPNHHNVINLSSSDEYSDDDLFVDPASTFDLDHPMDNGTNATQDITSRYFPPPSPGFDPADDFESGPAASSSEGRKRPYTKRPRRKNGGSTGSWKARGSRAKSKTSDRATSKSSAPRKTAKAKAPTSAIGMMPV